MSLKIAVTEQEYNKARDVFQAAEAKGCRCIPVPAAEEVLAKTIAHEAIRHAIIGVERYSGPLYEALARGGVIARFGVGHDGVDKAKATARKILCTNTPGALDASVAEHTVNLILAAVRQTATQAGALRAGTWSPQMGTELAGKKLAVIGCGEIGKRVARIAAFGFGMAVVGLKRSLPGSNQDLGKCGFREITTSFADAAAKADFVSLHIPVVPETRHFLDRQRLGILSPKCWVINTARGALIDEEALFDALATRKIAGAAQDVFEHEPYTPVRPDKDLRQLQNTVMTPHISSSTHEACRRMADQCLANIRFAEAGAHDRMNLLNPEVLQNL